MQKAPLRAMLLCNSRNINTLLREIMSSKMHYKGFIKICGITSLEDAKFAAESGADAVGFIAYEKSPRFISPQQVREIVCRLDNFNLKRVGVFVNATSGQIEQYINAGIDTVQLHGNESALFAAKCAELAEVWKVIKPQSEEDIAKFAHFPVNRFLLDTFHKELAGGTGITIDTELAKFAVGHLPKPVILAGGLSPENCPEIIRKTAPAGIDVNSGVEHAPGIKDHTLIQKLFCNLGR